MLSAGVLIAGKYRVLKKLGEGAMGSVWLAKNEVTDREFAVKMLLPAAASAPAALARFFQEARVCGALRHPSILEIYDAGTAQELDGAPYLVMERLDGASLDALLEQRGALSPRLALDILSEISRGLQLAHVKGIVHRDLKPANVFLHRPGTGAVVPKVLDFGISKVIDRASPAIALTQSSAILGSPIYMSPEQMDPGRALDPRSDVHALGVLLWECLTGTAPFTSTSYNNLVVEIMRGPRPRLKDAMPSATEGLARIVERAFAIDVGERFASAAELADAVDAELATLGGGVLMSRTAAADVLGGLDLRTKPPPPLEGSTIKPLAVDRERATAATPATVLAESPRRGEIDPRKSFAETEVAPSTGQPAPAASQSREAPRTPRWLVLAGAGAALLVVAALVLLALGGSGSTGAAADRPQPAHPAAALPSAPAAPLLSSASSASPASPASPAPASAAPVPAITQPQPPSAVAPALPRPLPLPRKPAASPPQPPPAIHPRIDQSGL
jgi:serine/threonine protein kinase